MSTSLQDFSAETVLNPNSTHTDWLDPAEVEELTAETVLARLRGLTETIAARANETERLRRVPEDLWSEIRRTGVFYLFVPKRYGGMEHGSLETFIDLLVILGAACGSTAWCTGLAVQQQFLIGQFSQRFKEEMWGRRPYVTSAGSGFPPGTAGRVDGGFVLGGRWKWCSGIMNADSANVGALVQEPDSPPVPHVFYIPIEDVTVLDTWHVDGVCGSGSHDIAVEGLFVPEHKAMEFRRITTGQPHHENPFYRLPGALLLAFSTAAPALGVARGGLEAYRRRVTGGTGTRKLADSAIVHKDFGAAIIDVDTAELLLRATAAELTGLVRTREPVPLEDRIRLRSQIARSANLCREAVRSIADVAGSSAHFLSDPLQRIVRDINVMTSHATLDLPAATELSGRIELGLESNHPWFR